MIETKQLFRVLYKSKWKPIVIQVKEICVFPSLCRKQNNPDYIGSSDVKSPLWYTTLPSSKKRALSLIDKKTPNLKSPVQTGDLIIECKNKSLNHYRGTYYSKFDAVPLASKHWLSRKVNDYFTILPTGEHPALKFPKSDAEKIPTTFKDAGVDDVLIKQLLKMGIKSPTVVQAKTIPHLLSGKQVLVASDTGSGKTLAYLIPVVQEILQIKSKNESISNTNAPLGVVVVHTKELSLQTGFVAEKLCSGLGLRNLTLVGGKAKSLVESPTFEPVDLVVSSLGVFLKLLRNKIYTLENCRILVADEADSLLDDTYIDYFKMLLSFSKVGFKPIHPLENKKFCQLCLVSATMPQKIEVHSDFLPVPFMEKITTNCLHKIQPHVTQHFIRVNSTLKIEKFLQYIKSFIHQKLPTVIFCNTQKSCDWLSYFMDKHNIDHIRLNGYMYANHRLSEFERFRCGNVNILCTTDGFSRGLDFPWVKRIINYDFPKYMADYIHRCGRTGRLGNSKNCQVINFVSKANQAALVNDIEMAVRKQTIIPNVNNNIRKVIKERALKHAAETRKTETLEIVPEIEMDENEKITVAS